MNNCKNCGKELFETCEYHEGYGAGSGETCSGVKICPICNEGCYEWERDDIPGFRDRMNYPCCKCGERP